MKKSVLIVEDDRAMRRALEVGLQDLGFEVMAAASAAEAFECLRERDVDVVLTDLNMPGENGIALCQRSAAERSDIPVIVITAFGSMDTAVAAIRAGAYDFITKPIDIDAVALALDRAVQHRRLRQEVKRLRSVAEGAPALTEFAGESEAIREVKRLVERIAPTDATVLITGESGTGKELVARALHRLSARRDGPFVAVNCAAIPELLLESELFGHARGAFTDAHKARTGLFARAQGGTLFLDEVGELPLSAQAKLLRALQERVMRPVGAERDVPFDARVVSATNRDLEALVEEGRFREDLLFRIHVLHVQLPPLRARTGDVLPLAQRFLRESAARAHKTIEGFGPAAAELLLNYPWPGNVRELVNCIEHATALARYDQIVPEDLPTRVREHRQTQVIAAGNDPGELLPLDEIERRYILQVFEVVGRNKRMAARVLGLDRKTLYRKLERYGIS